MSRLRAPNGLLFEYGESRPSSGIERETVGCRHCQTTAISKEQDKDWGVCYSCMGIVCGPCYGAGKCTPWEEWFQKAEARDAARRSMGLT